MERVMASCAEGHELRQLLGDELFEDYFDENTNLGNTGQESRK